MVLQGFSDLKVSRKKNSATTATIALWYTVGNVLNKGIAAISTPIFSRLLSKEEYGQFSNITSWISILFVIVTIDFTASIARAKYDYDGKMDEYIMSVTLAGNIVTLLSYVIIELNQKFFVDFFSFDIRYIRLVFLYMFFAPTFSYLQIKHRVYREYKTFVLLSVISAIGRTIISIMLVVIMDDKLLGRMYGYVIPITLLNIVLWISIIAKGRHFSLDSVKYASKISIPLIPHALSGILLGNSDRVMITNMLGGAQTAPYSMAYSVSSMSSLLWSSMNQAFAPWLFDKINENDNKSIRNKTRLYLGTFAALIIGLMLLAPEIILIMGGKKYYEARFIMPPVIMGLVFQFVYSLYVNIEMYAKKTFSISIGTVGAALLNVGLNYIFIPRYGYVAAAYTTLIGYAFLYCFHKVMVYYSFREYYDIYDSFFEMGVIIALLLLSFVSLLLYATNIVRYLLILAYVASMAIVLYKYRDKVLPLFGIKVKK